MSELKKMGCPCMIDFSFTWPCPKCGRPVIGRVRRPEQAHAQCPVPQYTMKGFDR